MMEFDWRNKTILVAEDDYVNGLLLNEVLIPTGIKIINVKNGVDAVKECSWNDCIDIILLDIKMPEMNGLEAIAEIKKLKPNVPIIAQTAYAFDIDKIKALEAGFNEYLVKPLKIETLLKTLESYLKN